MPTTQTVHIQTYDYGASLSSATLRVVSTDVLVATADTVNEVTADSGLYAVVFGETAVIAAGEYRLRAIVSGKPINRYVTLAGTDGEIVEARNERLAVLDSAVGAQITAIETFATRMTTGIVQDGLVWQFTANMLELGPSGSGGDATLAKQVEILTAVESVVDTVAAYAARMALEVQLRGFPNVICRNADYLEATESEIRITVEDLTGAAVTEIAGTPVASLSWLFGMGTEQDPALIAGTCTWDGDSDELVIEIAKAATAGKQTGSLTWQIGVSIGAARRWLGGGTTRLIERQF